MKAPKRELEPIRGYQKGIDPSQRELSTLQSGDAKQSLKISKLLGKLIITSAPLDPSRLYTHLRERELDGVKIRKSPQIPAMWRSSGESAPSIVMSARKAQMGAPHTTSKCRELKKALQELTNKGQLNLFLRRSNGEDRNLHDLEGRKANDVNCDMKIITIIIGGIDD
ncbi:LOW QUALITY PROTEIN: hypothetical protein Cgig2_026701 [Carnegiea gigantea]|nr:LOW QUALITY PROTEIN: hypothetical protein Cgig2_026701 [Carnegiea gigantea]